MWKLNFILFQLVFSVVLLTNVETKKGGGGGGGGGGRTGGGLGGGTGNSGGAGNRGGSQPAPPPRVGGAPSVAAAPAGGSKIGGGGRSFGTGLAVGAAGGLLAGGLVGAAVANEVSRGSNGGYHDGRYYYYGDRNYPGPAAGMMKCTLKVGNDFHANYSDGSPITEMVYECDRAREVCCNSGCCPINSSNGGVSSVPMDGPNRRPSLLSILIPLIGLAIVVGIVCFIVFKCIKRRGRDAAPAQTVYYETGGPQATVVGGQKEGWTQPPQPAQPYYPSPQGYPQPPPPAYANYGFQGQAPMQHQQQSLYPPH